MTGQPLPPWADDVDWIALAKLFGEAQVSLLHHERSDLYGTAFDAEALRRAVTHYSVALISTAEAERNVDRAISTWKFNAKSADEATEHWKALYFEARDNGVRTARKEIADFIRQTAHSVSGKFRQEGYRLLADRLDPQGAAGSDGRAS